MVSRREVLVGLTAGTLAFSGCGIRRKDISRPAAIAAGEVDGVVSAELEQVTGAKFELILRGTLALAATDRDGGLAVFDQAMRLIVTVIHEELDGETASGMRVGWISAQLEGGAELTALDLDPDMPTADPRLDRVTAGSFYQKYGIG